MAMSERSELAPVNTEDGPGKPAAISNRSIELGTLLFWSVENRLHDEAKKALACDMSLYSTSSLCCLLLSLIIPLTSVVHGIGSMGFYKTQR